LSTGYLQHSVERIGENSHLLIIYIAGMVIDIYNWKKRSRLCKMTLTAFIMLVSSVVIGGFRHSWMDTHHYGGGVIQFADMIIFNLVSLFHIGSEIFGWSLILIVIYKLQKNDKL
jgi:uncharacterized membrane protein (DUF485 family)